MAVKTYFLFPERYRALMQATRSLMTCTNLDDVVDKILRHSLELLQVETCSMYLPDSKTEELIIFSARGAEDSEVHSSRIPWHAGIAGHVFHKRETVRIDDVQNDARFYKGLDQKTGFQTRAMLCMPLTEKGKCHGVLQAINPKQSRTFTDVDLEIFEGFVGIVTSAIVRLEREKQQADEARMARELALAHEIQQSFLPPEKNHLPNAEVHVRYQPARSLGGDFYAIVPMSDDRILFAVGDVSGKGVPAALTTAQMMGEISVLSLRPNLGLTEAVSLINKNLCCRLGGGRFISTTFILYNPQWCSMEVLCAGQFAPWRWNGQKWEHVESPNGVPIGIVADFKYESASFECQPWERWMLCSDGINEGRNQAGEEFGFDRFMASLGQGKPEAVIEHSWKTWQQFVARDYLHDDACLALFTCVPPSACTITSDPCQCKSVRAYVEGWSAAAGFDDVTRGQIVLAVDEAFTNILRHAYEGEKGLPIETSASIEEGSLIFKLRDVGRGFDPACTPERNLDEVKPGGLGLSILKQTFEEIRYEPREPGTELILSKRLPV